MPAAAGTARSKRRRARGFAHRGTTAGVPGAAGRAIVGSAGGGATVGAERGAGADGRVTVDSGDCRGLGSAIVGSDPSEITAVGSDSSPSETEAAPGETADRSAVASDSAEGDKSAVVSEISVPGNVTVGSPSPESPGLLTTTVGSADSSTLAGSADVLSWGAGVGLSVFIGGIVVPTVKSVVISVLPVNHPHRRDLRVPSGA
jgi:hypothetical protein